MSEQRELLMLEARHRLEWNALEARHRIEWSELDARYAHESRFWPTGDYSAKNLDDILDERDGEIHGMLLSHRKEIDKVHASQEREINRLK